MRGRQQTFKRFLNIDGKIYGISRNLDNLCRNLYEILNLCVEGLSNDLAKHFEEYKQS